MCIYVVDDLIQKSTNIDVDLGLVHLQGVWHPTNKLTSLLETQKDLEAQYTSAFSNTGWNTKLSQYVPMHVHKDFKNLMTKPAQLQQLDAATKKHNNHINSNTNTSSVQLTT
jgi:hypothetical protein